MILEAQILLDSSDNYLKIIWFSGEQDDENELRIILIPNESGKPEIELGHTNLGDLKMLVNLIEKSVEIVT